MPQSLLTILFLTVAPVAVIRVWIPLWPHEALHVHLPSDLSTAIHAHILLQYSTLLFTLKHSLCDICPIIGSYIQRKSSHTRLSVSEKGWTLNVKRTPKHTCMRSICFCVQLQILPNTTHTHTQGQIHFQRNTLVRWEFFTTHRL